MVQIRKAAELFSDASSPSELVSRREEFIAEMTKATVAGLTGETIWGTPDQSAGELRPPVVRNTQRHGVAAKALEEFQMAKSAGQDARSTWDQMSKEWTLSNPISTGLLPFDLEAPAKLLTPRPTPIRNSIPRIKGQGGSRRFKVISGFLGKVRMPAMA